MARRCKYCGATPVNGSITHEADCKTQHPVEITQPVTRSLTGRLQLVRKEVESITNAMYDHLSNGDTENNEGSNEITFLWRSIEDDLGSLFQYASQIDE